MPPSTSQRLTRAMARLLLFAAVACGDRTPPDPASSTGDPLGIVRDEARRTGRELLLTIRLYTDIQVSFADERERREAVERVLASGAEFGVLPRTMEVEVDYAAGRDRPNGCGWRPGAVEAP